MADNGPVDAQARQVLGLPLGLLDLVLTHMGDASGVGDAQPLLGDSLGHGQQTDLGGVASGALGGGDDLGANRLQVVPIVLHGGGSGGSGGPGSRGGGRTVGKRRLRLGHARDASTGGCAGPGRFDNDHRLRL